MTEETPRSRGRPRGAHTGSGTLRRHADTLLGRAAAVARGMSRPLPALAAFGLLAALFFWQLWAPNAADRHMIGAADGDFVRQFYPYRVFVARTWASGRLPAWNPHQYGGAPAWADPQQAVAYPWRALQVPFAAGGRTLPLWAVELEAVAHVALGAWFAFLLARRLGAGAAGAAVTAIAFGYGGYLTGYPIDQLAVVGSAAWIPAALWALTGGLDAAAAGRRPAAVRFVLLAGAASALSGLAGHPQTAVYGLYLCAAWLAFRAWRSRVPARLAAAVLVSWLGLAAGLAAVQWAPSVELLARSGRALSYQELAAGLKPADVVQMVAPPPARAASGPSGAAEMVWVPLFVGSVTLWLAAWGAVRVRRAWFWLAAAAAGAVMSLGGANPLFPVVVRLVPGLSLFRHQERFAVVFALCGAVAAGLAFDELLRRGPRAAREAGRALLSLAAIVAIVAAALYLSGRPDLAVRSDGLALTALVTAAAGGLLLARAERRVTATALAAGVIALIGLEVFSVNRGRALTPYADPTASDAVLETLVERAREGRVSSEALLPGGPNAASLHALYDVTGDLALRPEVLERLERVPEMVRWRLLGVRFVVSQRAFAPNAPVRELAREGQRALYEVQLPVPPAWVAGSVTAVSDEALAAWAPAPDFDPQAVVLLPSGAVPSPPPAPGPPAAGREARLTGLDPGRAVVEARLPAPGVLVLASPYDPGWRARAVPRPGLQAGAPASASAAGALRPRVEPAYGSLTAVWLPAGEWVVEWTYRPLALHLGVALSGATMLLGAYLWRRSLTRPT